MTLVIFLLKSPVLASEGLATVYTYQSRERRETKASTVETANEKVLLTLRYIRIFIMLP